MPKKQIQYICESCGAQSASWSGKCFTCGEWNTLVEQVVALSGPGGTKTKAIPLKTQTIAESAKNTPKRLKTNFADIDAVLGGGLVPGSVLLIAGEPGIGKSTLLLQLAHAVSKSSDVLYVSGEESPHQVSMRANRIKSDSKRMQISNATTVEDIAASISSQAYQLVVVDSIQTMVSGSINSSAGSVSQITSCTHILMNAAKASHVALIIVGHVTKEGSIAGPKILEHIVDVVLQLEGDRYGGFKILRSNKNRFGSTNETAILEMTDGGMQVVANPSEALLAERQVVDGSVVLATMEGSRPILVEVQSLVNKTAYGYPKRAASGFDLNRLNLLIAMLEKRTKLQLSDKDIYVNIVGGIKITEPAADLAICMSIGSAASGLLLRQNAAVFGEVGLSGEVRSVMNIDKRIAEAKKMGLEAAVGPRLRSGNLTTNKSYYNPTTDVRTALNTLLKK